MTAKILPFEPKRPSRAQIKKTLDELVNCELAQFGVNLSIARAMWQEHRHLVEAGEFPEPYASAMEAEGEDVETYADSAPTVQGLRRQKQQEAERLAEIRLLRG
jgi:hypothetical protein